MLPAWRPDREPRVRVESVVAPAVKLPTVAPFTALNCPPMVVEAEEEKLVVVAAPKVRFEVVAELMNGYAKKLVE